MKSYTLDSDLSYYSEDSLIKLSRCLSDNFISVHISEQIESFLQGCTEKNMISWSLDFTWYGRVQLKAVMRCLYANSIFTPLAEKIEIYLRETELY